MIVLLSFGIQWGETIIKPTNEMCHVFAFYMQEDNFVKNINVKCQLCTL